MRIAGYRVETASNRLIARAVSKVGGDVEVRLTATAANPEYVQIRAYFVKHTRQGGKREKVRTSRRIPLAEAISRSALEDLKMVFMKCATSRALFFRGAKHDLPGAVWV